MPWYYIFHLLILFCIYAHLALGYNLSLGFTGLSLLGIVGFFAVGAYAYPFLVFAGVPYIVCLLCSGIVAGIVGFLLAFPSLRMKGGYFSVATLGFGEILRLFINNEVWLTNGPYGIRGIPNPEILGFQFDSYEKMLLLVVVSLLVTFFFFERLVRSPYGRVLRSIREDEMAASTLGKHTWSFKMQVLVVTAFFAGIAGNLWASYLTYIDPNQFTRETTVLVLSMIVLGGLGNNKGALAGVAIMLAIPELLRFLAVPPLLVGAIRQLIMGATLVFIMVRRPEGLFGIKKK